MGPPLAVPFHVAEAPEHPDRPLVVKAGQARADEFSMDKFRVGDRKCTRCGHVGALRDYVPNVGSRFGRKNLCLQCSRKRAPTERFTAGNLFPTIAGVELSDTSLAVRDGKLRQQEWESALRRVVRLERGAQWWVGDLVAFGEGRYGETYTAAVRQTGRALQTLKIYAWVSRHVAPANRRPELPWRSHRLVAPLPAKEQRKWLGLASRGGWTSDELGRELRDAGHGKAKPDAGAGTGFPDPEDDAGGAERGYRCPACGHEWSGDPRPKAKPKPGKVVPLRKAA